MRLTKALLPKLIASGDGHVVTITSIAGLEIYDGGAGYTAAKHAQSRCTARCAGSCRPAGPLHRDPAGRGRHEFSLVRFGGDAERADEVYQGMTPLMADDVADDGRVRHDPPEPRQHRHPRDEAARPGERDAVP